MRLHGYNLTALMIIVKSFFCQGSNYMDHTAAVSDNMCIILHSRGVPFQNDTSFEAQAAPVAREDTTSSDTTSSHIATIAALAWKRLKSIPSGSDVPLPMWPVKSCNYSFSADVEAVTYHKWVYICTTKDSTQWRAWIRTSSAICYSFKPFDNYVELRLLANQFSIVTRSISLQEGGPVAQDYSIEGGGVR